MAVWVGKWREVDFDENVGGKRQEFDLKYDEIRSIYEISNEPECIQRPVSVFGTNDEWGIIKLLSESA